jgi:hypothetical protein
MAMAATNSPTAPLASLFLLSFSSLCSRCPTGHQRRRPIPCGADGRSGRRRRRQAQAQAGEQRQREGREQEQEGQQARSYSICSCSRAFAPGGDHCAFPPLSAVQRGRNRRLSDIVGLSRLFAPTVRCQVKISHAHRRAHL